MTKQVLLMVNLGIDLVHRGQTILLIFFGREEDKEPYLNIYVEQMAKK